MRLGWILIQFAISLSVTQEGVQFFIVLTTLFFTVLTTTQPRPLSGGRRRMFLSFLRLLSADLSSRVILLLGSLADFRKLVTLARNSATESASILFVYWSLLIANSVSVIISDTGISAGVGDKFSPNCNTLVSADVRFFNDKLTTHLFY